MQKLGLFLGDPSHTNLHRAGLAGLYMTLSQLDKENIKPPAGLSWKLFDRAIALEWEGSDEEALSWLIKQSFQLEDGLISFRAFSSSSGETMRSGGIGKEMIPLIHEGILGTLLQHNQSKGTLPPESKVLTVEDVEIAVRYRPISWYSHQKFVSELVDTDGQMKKSPISIKGWLFPGGTVRHQRFDSTAVKESSQNALALLFAPIACYYYLLRSHLGGKKAQYAMVIPQVVNMKDFGEYKKRIHHLHANYKDFYAGSLGDAALRFLTYEKTVEISQVFGLSSCQVVVFGNVAWSTQQKTRTDIFTVDAATAYQNTHNYQLARRVLGDRMASSKDKSWITVNPARELVTKNLVEGKEWYAGFEQLASNTQTFQQLEYISKGLKQMTTNATYNDETDKLLIASFEEGLRFHYSKESKKPGYNFQRVKTKIISRLKRCKNAENFTIFALTFLVEGKIDTFAENRDILRPLLMNRKRLKLNKACFMLAIIGYQSKYKDKELSSKDDSEE